MELIYCAAGNKEFARIAIEAGHTYGAQPMKKFYYDIGFADIDPNNVPPQDKYLAKLAQHKPRIASVMDWDKLEDFETVLEWAEEAAAYSEVLIITPKIPNTVELIPTLVGWKPIRLGYSVPTSHGGTSVPVWEFGGRPVHLLGGSPQAQRNLAYYLNVASADGNMSTKMATRFCAFFDPQKRTKRGYWPTLLDYDGQRWGDGSSKANAPYEAFRRSCQNIMKMWR